MNDQKLISVKDFSPEELTEVAIKTSRNIGLF